jgi:hypothetical protein
MSDGAYLLFPDQRVKLLHMEKNLVQTDDVHGQCLGLTPHRLATV